MRRRLLRNLPVCVLLLGTLLGVLSGRAQTTAPTTQPVSARPPVNRVVGWVGIGAESVTPNRNVGYINGPPSGYVGSVVEQELNAFADAGWKRLAVRSPWGTTPNDLNNGPIGWIRFEQPLDAVDQGFGWLDQSYRLMWAKLLRRHPDFEEIDYIGCPETLLDRGPLVSHVLSPLTQQVLAHCGRSVTFDASSGVAQDSFSMSVFARCDALRKKAYLEAVPLASCPWLFDRPFFIQESFDETYEAQQAQGHAADWAPTRQQLKGERICILDQPPAGATWDVPVGVTQDKPWTGPNHDAWAAAADKILSRGDTLAADPNVIMALYPTR